MTRGGGNNDQKRQLQPQQLAENPRVRQKGKWWGGKKNRKTPLWGRKRGGGGRARGRGKKQPRGREILYQQRSKEDQRDTTAKNIGRGGRLFSSATFSEETLGLGSNHRIRTEGVLKLEHRNDEKAVI